MSPMELHHVERVLDLQHEQGKPVVGIGGQGTKALVDQMPKIAVSAYLSTSMLSARVCELSGARQLLAGFKEVLGSMGSSQIMATVVDVDLVKELYAHLFEEELRAESPSTEQMLPSRSFSLRPSSALSTQHPRPKSRSWRRKLSIFGGKHEFLGDEL